MKVVFPERILKKSTKSPQETVTLKTYRIEKYKLKCKQITGT